MIEIQILVANTRLKSELYSQRESMKYCFAAMQAIKDRLGDFNYNIEAEVDKADWTLKGYSKGLIKTSIKESPTQIKAIDFADKAGRKAAGLEIK